MKKSIGDSGRTIIGVLAIVVLAAVFWIVLLQPKRDKASELSSQEAAIASEVAAAQATASTAEAAKQQFPADYRQLVQLGKAVPAEAETSSLLVQLNGLSSGVHTSFRSISLGTGGEGEAAPVEGTEASALSPVGASPGPSGLLAMPYALEFEGGFFDLARFLHKLDSLVVTNGEEVAAKGRLVMVDGFTMAPLSSGEEAAGNTLSASLSVNTYVTPPGQGITAGATPEGPAEAVSESTATTAETP